MTNLKSQSGRSMVEMLGVLSIIGVLSVGGINAYSTAMKKHKANELLKQASMHAVEVSSQIMSGKEPTGLSDFGTDTTIELDTDSMAGQTTFKLILSDIDGDVCEQLKGMKGGIMRDVTCDGTTATLTYYKNLATNDVEGAKSPIGEKVDSACKDVECEEGLTCFHGECKCSNGAFKCGDKCCGEGSYCAQGDDTSTYTCAIPTGECTKNSDCGEDEYCQFTEGTCNTPGKGTCVDKGSLEMDFNVKILNLPKGDLTTYKSLNSMNWWSAINFCQAHGLQLVTKTDLGISDPLGKDFCYFDNTKIDYTSKPCICQNNDTDCSQTTTELYKFGKSEVLWLADNNITFLCNAAYISLNYSRFYCGKRSDIGNHYAFCRDP